MSHEFIDYLYAISSALETGVSLSAAMQSADDLLALMQGNNSLMCAESKTILDELARTGTNPVAALRSFAKRTGLKEAFLFSSVCEICIEHGGNLAIAVHHAEMLLTERLERKNDMEVKLTEKKLEFFILLAMPFFILLFLTYTSASYMDVLYTSLKGYVIITFCLLLMIAAVVWSRQILQRILSQ